MAPCWIFCWILTPFDLVKFLFEDEGLLELAMESFQRLRWVVSSKPLGGRVTLPQGPGIDREGWESVPASHSVAGTSGQA